MKSFESRFWQYVDKNGPIPQHQPHLGPCWLWTGWLSKARRGCLQLGGNSKRNMASYRASWVVHFGEIPTGLFVLHHCDNPQCVRPSHLYLGTQADNIRDMVMRGRACTGDKQGRAKLTWPIVQTIREAHGQGISGAELARRHEVSETQIHRIVHNQDWKVAPYSSLSVQ